VRNGADEVRLLGSVLVSLSVSNSDPNRFTASIERRKVGFELIAIEVRKEWGRRNRNGISDGVGVWGWGRRCEVVYGVWVWEISKDESIASDPALIVRGD